jgi:hypothetical protein
MVFLPKTHDFPPPTKATNGLDISGKNTRHRTIARIMNPDLLAIVAFCLIGLLLMLNLMFRFPDLGAVIEQFNQF